MNKGKAKHWLYDVVILFEKEQNNEIQWISRCFIFSRNIHLMGDQMIQMQFYMSWKKYHELLNAF